MKSNFGKSKRWAPKSGKTRNIKSTPRSTEPVKTKPLNLEKIKKAQEALKNQEINKESTDEVKKNK